MNVNEVLKDLLKVMFKYEPDSTVAKSRYRYDEDGSVDSEYSSSRSVASDSQVTDQDITDVITSLYGCSEQVSNYIKKGTIKQPNELFQDYSAFNNLYPAASKITKFWRRTHLFERTLNSRLRFEQKRKSDSQRKVDSDVR